MKKNFAKNIILLISLSIFFDYDACKAQEATNKIPELNGHIFVPENYTEDPFNNTFFELGVGIATTGEFKYPISEVDGEKIYAFRGELLFANVGLQYQQKIQDWASLYIRYNLSTRLGTNIGTILAEGFSTVNKFQIGWKIRIIERKRFILATNFGINNYSGTFLSVSKFVEDVIDENPYPSLVTNIPALNANLGFQFAYGINELFGFRLSFTNSLGESLERGKTDYFFLLGTSIDANFYRRYNIPIGLSLSYRTSSLPEQVFAESGLSNGFKLKIAYTGTDDFVIGVQTNFTVIPIASIEGNYTTRGGAFFLTYYFN